MKRLAVASPDRALGLALPLALALAACGEPSAVRLPPTDRFVHPATLAVTARQGGGTALVVASGNYDLSYDGAEGGTVLSLPVRPDLPLDGGSARPGGGAFVPLGEGARVASFAGELVVADQDTCPIAGAGPQPPEALLATRFANQVWRLPLGVDGSLAPCTAADCTVTLDRVLKDPFGMALACRADRTRRSAFVGYQREAVIGDSGLTGWVAQIDLDDPTAPARPIALGAEAMSGMAYDAVADRLYVLGRPLLSAPVHLLDLTPCPAGLAACAKPVVTTLDLSAAMNGLDLQSIALSNPQPGLGRRAYVSARLYDANLAALIGVRPGTDLGAVLLVLDVEEGLGGVPRFRVLDMVDVALGSSQVRVLPVRAAVAGLPQRDVVVVSGDTEGVLTVYDDEQGRVVRVIPISQSTGAPQVGRGPYGLAALRRPPPDDGVARVYVAASQQGVVSIVDVPLAAPDHAETLRDGATGPLIRIGGLQ